MTQEKTKRRRPPRTTKSRRPRSRRVNTDEYSDVELEASASESSDDKKAAESNASAEKTPEAAIAELTQTKKPYAEWDFLTEAVRKGIADYGYTNPTPVQTAAIEPSLHGRDMVVQAKTGTGKTAAFGIPLLVRFEQPEKLPRALILTPTRELAGQVARELQGIGAHTKLNIISVYGGTSIQNQIDALEKGADIVVGTPGRVLDHIRRKTLDITNLETIALDEADEMLSMGFYLEVSSIIESCKNRKQLMLFSATLAPDIEGLVRQYTKKPIRLMVSGGDRRVTGISHIGYFNRDDLSRPRNLLYLLEHESPSAAIIFCNRRDETEMLALYLSRNGKAAEAINGDMNQNERESALKKLDDGKLQYLVATDVAARGIDISGLSHIVNYSFPTTIDLYIHRAGRTGRQGREGTAISMLSGEDLGNVLLLKQAHKIFFEICELPPMEEVVRLAASKYIGNMFADAMQDIIESHLPLADAIQNDPRGRYIVAHLLKMYHEDKLGKKSVEQGFKGNEEPEIPAEAPVEKAAAPEPAAAPVEEPAAAEPPAEETSSRAPEAPAGPSQDSVRLYINVGASEGLEPETLCQIIAEEIGTETDVLSFPQVERSHSFINTDPDTAEQILAAFQEKKVNDELTVTAEVARKPRRRRRR